MRTTPPTIAGFEDGRGMSHGLEVGKDKDIFSPRGPGGAEPCLCLDG